jgi:hypothetical protein
MSNERVSASAATVSASTAITPKAVVSVGAADQQIVAASNRVAVWLSNTHATQTVDLAFGATAVAGQGIRLKAGETQKFCEFTGEIRGIASGAATTVGVIEV